jgi:hypothetical protein
LNPKLSFRSAIGTELDLYIKPVSEFRPSDQPDQDLCYLRDSTKFISPIVGSRLKNPISRFSLRTLFIVSSIRLSPPPNFGIRNPSFLYPLAVTLLFLRYYLRSLSLSLSLSLEGTTSLKMTRLLSLSLSRISISVKWSILF